MARVVAVLLGYDHLPGATLTRYCSSSLQTTRMAFHAIKAGEGDVFISAGVETRLPVRPGQLRRAAARGAGARRRRLAEPALRRRPRPVARARAAPALRPWTRPARGRRAARRLPGHGPDRGEPRPGLRRDPRGDGRVRRTVAEPGREGDRRRLLGPRDHPGDRCPTARSCRTDDGPRAGRDPGGGRRRSSRCSARTAGSPPATAARSTTAPPRWSS